MARPELSVRIWSFASTLVLSQPTMNLFTTHYCPPSTTYPLPPTNNCLPITAFELPPTRYRLPTNTTTILSTPVLSTKAELSTYLTLCSLNEPGKAPASSYGTSNHGVNPTAQG